MSSSNASEDSFHDHHDPKSLNNSRYDDSMMDEEDPIRAKGGGSDFDGSSSSDLQSRSSGSSNSTLARMRKSTLPCGMSMPVMMAILIMVPIIFLCVYTGIPVNESLAAKTVLADHRSVIRDILYIASRIQDERREASLFLASDVNSTTAQEQRTEIENLRTLADIRFSKMVTTMQDSDLEGRVEFLAQAQSQMRLIERSRQRVDDRTANGATMRRVMLDIIEQVYSLLAWFAKDSRGNALQYRIVILMLLRRIQNSVAMLRAVGISLMSYDGNGEDNYKELWAMRSSINRDIEYCLTTGKDEVIVDINTWRDHPDTLAFWTLCDQLEAGLRDNVSMDEWLDRSDTLLTVMENADRVVVDVITNGELLNEIAIVEGMKMFGAIFACFLACILVIYYNNREQARLEKALDSTAILAAAVQRFVPKNQLRTMGVRSITQVQPGMTTEVAQTIIFSDIMGFSTLSESLGRLELFDWLQDYVARMSSVVAEEKSYISNFLGDGLMIIAAQPTNGVNACIKMHVAVDTLNLELVAKNGTLPVRIGCGIHYGVVVAGVFGDENRLTCTTIAADVNLASRMEQLTRSFGAKILASEAVVDRISAEVFLFRCVGKVRVSGSSKSVLCYDVYQADPLNVKTYKNETKQAFEEAVRLAETEPEVAAAKFRELLLIAESHGVKDKAVQSRKTGAELDGAAGLSSRASSCGHLSATAEQYGSFNNNNFLAESDKNHQQQSNHQSQPQTAIVDAFSNSNLVMMINNDISNSNPNLNANQPFCSTTPSAESGAPIPRTVAAAPPPPPVNNKTKQKNNNTNNKKNKQNNNNNNNRPSNAMMTNKNPGIIDAGILHFEKDGEIRVPETHIHAINAIAAKKQQQLLQQQQSPITSFPPAMLMTDNQNTTTTTTNNNETPEEEIPHSIAAGATLPDDHHQHQHQTGISPPNARPEQEEAYYDSTGATQVPNRGSNQSNNTNGYPKF